MATSMRFDGTVVTVTGSASGIGRATARSFAEEGARVVVADVDGEAGTEVADTLTDETEGIATFVETDVTEDGDVREMVTSALDEYGTLDVAVNNAGIGARYKPLTELSPDEWQSVIDVNLTGVWRCMKHEIEAMVEDGGGSIVNTASILGQVSLQNTSEYTAAKHGVVGLTKAAALEYADAGIRVNAVCPGYTDTPLIDSSAVTQDAEAGIGDEHPMGRYGEPDEIASGIVWLSSEDASFTTGESLVIDGGYLSK